LDAWEDRYPEIVKQLREGLYVDDLITGGNTVAEIQTQKEKTIEVFDDATFTIHK
jgi:predicted amidophosphoribosyltransferase